MSFLKINNLSVDYKMRKETVYAAKNVNNSRPVTKLSKQLLRTVSLSDRQIETKLKKSKHNFLRFFASQNSKYLHAISKLLPRENSNYESKTFQNNFE